MNKLTFTALAAALAFSQAHAAFTIRVISNDAFGRYLEPDGVTNVNENYEVQFGVFDRVAFDNLDPAQKMDFATVSSLLSTNANQTFSFDSNGDMSVTGEYGQPTDPDLAGTPTPSAGDDLYVLVYNTLNNAVFGLYGGLTDWEVPVDLQNTNLLTVDLGASNALVGSLSGNNAVLANTVPEPSTYAFVAGLMTLGLVAYRRRQRA